MTNLPVPYKSQWDADAGKTANDCGPASIAMWLAWQGVSATTNDVFDRTGAGLGLIGFSEMIKAINSYGFSAKLESGRSPERIKELLTRGNPPLITVHYGSLNSTQDKTFKGGHMMLVVGYRDDGYFVNDPNFKGNFRQDGDHHFYTKAELERAWGDCHLDGNPDNSLIVIEPKTTTQPGGDELTVCMADRTKFWRERDEARAEVERQRKVIDNLNQQINDRNRELDEVKRSREGAERERDEARERVGSLEEQAKKIKPLEEQVEQLTQDRKLAYQSVEDMEKRLKEREVEKQQLIDNAPYAFWQYLIKRFGGGDR